MFYGQWLNILVVTTELSLAQMEILANEDSDKTIY